jgi:hypothetical protein
MTPPQTAAPAPERAPVKDEMPLNGIHHVELYVGNAEQAAYFLKHGFGFRETAYAATGSRTSSSRDGSASSSPARCTAATRSPATWPTTATA